MKEKILFTGESGLLGSTFKRLMPGAEYPLLDDFDITNYEQMERYVQDAHYTLLIHAAAFTSPPAVDKNPLLALETNIMGTCNVVKLCMKFGIKLVYISTDYVFNGNEGNYKEDAPVYPVNKYAWSKMGGECAVRMHDNSLIIRTSFGPDVFPYEKAFVDQWTSRESVSNITGRIIKLLEKNVTGVFHVGGHRKTVYEYATSLDSTKEIGELSIKNVSFKAPVDTSLNCDKYNSLME